MLARFKGSYYDGAPALVCNHAGSGTSYYFGAGFSAGAARIFLEKLGFAEPYGGIIELPGECELAVRSKDEVDYLFVLNYHPVKIKFSLRLPAYDLLTGRKLSGEVELDPYGVAVLNIPDFNR